MSLGLRIQKLTSTRARVLAVLALAEMRSPDGWFSQSDVEETFREVRVPEPKALSAELSRLRGLELLIARPGRSAMALTPTGRERAEGFLGQVNPFDALSDAPPVFADAQLSVLPPLLAPARWREGIQQLLSESEFDRNVFCMTRFPEDRKDENYLDPVASAIPAARRALAQHGLNLCLASERQLDDDLYGNIAAHMWACRYGLALFEDRLGRGLNQNLLIEVGAMLTIGRRCALLRDTTIASMPTDFVGRIYKSIDLDDPATVTAAVHQWVSRDLGRGECSAC